jgi:hypothetical protein
MLESSYDICGEKIFNVIKSWTFTAFSMMQYPSHVIRIQGSIISETTAHFLQVW